MRFGSAPGVSEFENGDGSVDETRIEAGSRAVSGLKSAFLEGSGGVVEVWAEGIWEEVVVVVEPEEVDPDACARLPPVTECLARLPLWVAGNGHEQRTVDDSHGAGSLIQVKETNGWATWV